MVLRSYQLWKGVEIQLVGNATDEARSVPGEIVSGSCEPRASGLRACSGCARDYEDPERTAGEASTGRDEKYEESDSEPRVRREFPVEGE